MSLYYGCLATDKENDFRVPGRHQASDLFNTFKMFKVLSFKASGDHYRL